MLIEYAKKFKVLMNKGVVVNFRKYNISNNLISLFIFFVSCFISSSSNAVDASSAAKVIYQNGSWKIVEITGNSKILYRIATDSINLKDTHLTIDFLKQCKAEPVVMIKKFSIYNPLLNKGKLILQYRIPDLLENQEIVETEMSQGDTWAFFNFKNLMIEKLYIAKESSRLAIWVPESGDGEVKRSANFYFSLEGFKTVYVKAKGMCEANS